VYQIILIDVNDVLLREYVRRVLREDYGGFDSSSDMGIDFTGGDPKKLYNVFLQPFADVFSTAKHGVEKLSNRLQTVGKVAFEAIGTTILPGMSSDYDKIFKDEKEQLSKLKDKYRDVYDRTWKAVKDNDILAGAFAYDPTSLITSKIAKESPKVVVGLLNTLTGGKLNNYVEKLKKKNSKKNDFDFSQLSALFSSVKKHESRIIGESSEIDSRVADMIKDNPKIQSMKDDARKIVRSSLEKMFDAVNVIGKAQTVDDLMKVVGKNIPQLNAVKKLKDPERSQVESKVVEAVKAAMKNFYVKKLNDQIKSAFESGVPREHVMIDDYHQAMQKIKAI